MHKRLYYINIAAYSQYLLADLTHCVFGRLGVHGCAVAILDVCSCVRVLCEQTRCVFAMFGVHGCVIAMCAGSCTEAITVYIGNV